VKTEIPKLYSIREVAEILSVHQLTVRRHINNGLLPAHRIGGVFRISHRSLMDFIEGKDEMEGGQRIPQQPQGHYVELAKDELDDDATWPEIHRRAWELQWDDEEAEEKD
jgi:excisionase family DNA binding protein